MRKFANYSIKWKLTLIILLTSTFSLLVAATAFFVFNLLEFKQREIKELGVLARITGETCGEALTKKDPKKAAAILATLAERPRIMSAVLTDSSGNVFAWYKASTPSGKKSAEIGETMTVSRRFIRGGKIIGRITITGRLDYMQRNVAYYIQITTLIFVSTLGATLLLSLFLQRFISMRITRLTDAVREIASGDDYSLSVQKTGNDEIGDLVDSFNAMVAQIKQREEDLQQHRVKLEQNEQRLALALQATNEILWDWDLLNETIYISEKWHEILGYLSEELPVTHDQVLSYVHSDDLGYLKKTLKQHIHHQTPHYETEFRLRKKDGSYIWIHDRGRVVEKEADGTALRMVGTYADITRQKVSELQISLQRALLKSMINSIPDLIFYKDLEGVYLGCNPAFCEFVGKDWDDVVGKRDEDLLDPDIAEDFTAKDGLMLDETKARIDEVWVTYPDGRKILLSTLRTPYYGPSSEILGVVGISRDLTAYREAEEELSMKQSQLIHSGRLAALGEMSTAIAHELGQPLQIIRTAAGIIREELSDDTTEKEELIPIIEKIIKQVTRSATIIHNVRSFARQDSGEEDVRLVDLAKVVSEALSFFHEQFAQHKILLEVEFEEELPLVLVNPQKIQQVIVNLLSNARFAIDQKALQKIPRYKKHVAVRLYHRKQPDDDPDYLIVEVLDNGIGMSKENRNRCLDPFYTTKPVGEGTGLGLSILYGIVKDAGGEVEIESDESIGSVFRILLPVPRAQES